MRGIERSNRRFWLQNILLFILMVTFAFVGVYASGQSAYRSANELGAMTADYLNLQVDAFMGQYEQILEDAAYMVNAMINQGASASEVEQWITAFSMEYDETMQYDESGIYGVIHGQGVFSSGWRPGEEYDIFARPWYLQAVAAPGRCARSKVYQDARTGTTLVSLSKLLDDGESVLALDIRVGEIEVEWEEGSDVFPGTATVVDQAGSLLLHQQIGQEHISCEMDSYTQEDYLAMLAQFEGARGMVRWDGELDSYQNYYIVGEDGWTCIVTIPLSVITQDATNLFYLQLVLQAAFLLSIIYLGIQSYRAQRRNRQAVDCFEALGQTYYCVALVDVNKQRCEITKQEGNKPTEGSDIRSYETFLAQIQSHMRRSEDWPGFLEQFSLAQLQQLCDGKQERRYLEFERNFPEGPRWVSAEAFAVENSQQVIIAFRLIHDSKTAELAKNQMLRESLESARMANQAKSDFLSRMSHDMRTPMNAVIGFANLARHSLDEPEKATNCLDKVTAASQQLLHLINEVLDTAKIEQGKMELHMAPVDLAELLEETASLFQLQAKAQHQRFSLLPLALQHRRVITDAVRLNQILNNLLSNAIKYTPAGGSIALQVEELAGDAQTNQPIYRFMVSDTGIGMSPKFLEKIFLPFEREDTSMTGTTSGVGLGMAITHNIVQMLGGQIQVESVQGKGSRFIVTIPCALPEDTLDAYEGTPDPGAAFSLQGRRLLLAEDNLLNQEIALELLGMEGAEVTAVENGRKAVEAFAQHPPQTYEAILMDIQMPELDGYAATREIRQMDRPDAGTIPILAMTANAFEDDIAAARAAGMNGHIAKPIDMAKVKAALAAVLKPEP